jgi:hypothetical protein
MSYSGQLEKYILNQQVSGFLGVFAADQLPNSPPAGSSLIVNYSQSNEQGTHWVAMRGLNTNACEYFDSYGMEPDDEDILLSRHTQFKAYLQRNSKGAWHRNDIDLQHTTSNVCGEYACKFITDGNPMMKDNKTINPKCKKYVLSNSATKNDKWIQQEIKLRHLPRK